MTRLAPLIGIDVTERCLLSKYAVMCTDALFHVRKVSLHIRRWNSCTVSLHQAVDGETVPLWQCPILATYVFPVSEPKVLRH